MAAIQRLVRLRLVVLYLFYNIPSILQRMQLLTSNNLVARSASSLHAPDQVGVGARGTVGFRVAYIRRVRCAEVQLW